MTKIIFFTFAGRRENLRVQERHVMALLDANPGSEFHLWDLTRNFQDQRYVREYAARDERIVYRGELHSGFPLACRGPRRRGQMPCVCMIHRPPYEQPYQRYAREKHDDDTVFVKFDDDVVWMDTARFSDVLAFLETSPGEIASANVVNNVVCAKYDSGLRVVGEALSQRPDETSGDDQSWWALHTDPVFAYLCHMYALNEEWRDARPEDPVKPRWGENISINFVAMKYPLLRAAADRMKNNRLGDEGAVDTFYPTIVRSFRVAHLAFGPQEAGLALHLDRIREQYNRLP